MLTGPFPKQIYRRDPSQILTSQLHQALRPRSSQMLTGDDLVIDSVLLGTYQESAGDLYEREENSLSEYVCVNI